MPTGVYPRTALQLARLEEGRLRHGHCYTGRRTPTYRSWDAMRQRCANPNCKGYEHYGGKGITVCARWDSFENFLEDMGERTANQRIHRIDNDGDYEPGNCVWVDRSEHNSLHKKRPN